MTDAHLTEYLNDNGRQADKMPVLCMEESKEALSLRDNLSNVVATGKSVGICKLKRNASLNSADGKRRPSSAPPGAGRSSQAPFRSYVIAVIN